MIINPNYQYIDLQSLKENTFDDISIMKEIMELFLEIIDEYINTLNQELPNKNWDALFKAAHKIKPNINMFGIHKLESTTLQLEHNFKNEENLDTVDELVSSSINIFKQVKIEVQSELKSMNND